MAWYTFIMPEFIPKAFEKITEALPESTGEQLEKKIEQVGVAKISQSQSEQVGAVVPAAPASAVPAAPVILQKKVEQVLEQGLDDLYGQLNDQDKIKFRTSGEATALKITNLLQQAKVRLSEILKLIRQWLLSIVGINKFFVEQEAKIKARKILQLKQEK